MNFQYINEKHACIISITVQQTSDGAFAFPLLPSQQARLLQRLLLVFYLFKISIKENFLLVSTEDQLKNYNELFQAVSDCSQKQIPIRKVNCHLAIIL